MKRAASIVTAWCLCAAPALADTVPTAADAPAPPRSHYLVVRAREAGGTIVDDYKNFYGLENGAWLALGIGVAGLMANTTMDERFSTNYQAHIRSNGTDSIAKRVRYPGYASVAIPLYTTAILAGEFNQDSPFQSTVGKWGRRSVRAVMLGGLPVLALQNVLGAQRPVEGGSEWRLLADNNAVSGEAFMGAVPFITAAKMTDNVFAKTGWYTASTLSGLSRINTNSHYLSQAGVGWLLAYLSACAVERTDRQHESKIRLSVMPYGVKATVDF